MKSEEVITTKEQEECCSLSIGENGESAIPKVSKIQAHTQRQTDAFSVAKVKKIPAELRIKKIDFGSESSRIQTDSVENAQGFAIS